MTYTDVRLVYGVKRAVPQPIAFKSSPSRRRSNLSSEQQNLSGSETCVLRGPNYSECVEMVGKTWSLEVAAVTNVRVEIKLNAAVVVVPPKPLLISLRN